MVSRNKTTKSNFQKRFLLVLLILFMLCLCLGQPTLASSSESSTSAISMSNSGQVASTLTLKVSSISPQDEVVLTNFPANLEIKVTRGGFPEEGARIQFWMEGGLADAMMHSAGFAMTDSSGYAHLTLLNQNILDPGQYIWYASATKAGFKGGSSQTISFTIPFSGNNRILTTSGGTVSTDQKEYSIGPTSGLRVVIYGNVNNYHMGQPIVLKITSRDGKIVQEVTYGTYLGAFQTVYKLGQDSKPGSYAVSVFYNYVTSSSNIFYVVK